MLGEPGDPVREAIEKISATKIAFRLNSMQEAAALAPDLMQLNLEMPVEVLTKETVVGYDMRRMNNASSGGNTTQTRSNATTRSRYAPRWPGFDPTMSRSRCRASG